MGIADPESRAYRHIRGLDTHLGSTKMGVTIMLFYLPLLIVATTMGKLSQGYEYNPAVMEQHALGNTILDVVAHVPEEEEEEGKGNEYDEDRELPPSTPNNAKPTDEMVAEAGYPVETHIVATDDGYLLSVHRIPRGRLVVDEQVEEEGARPTVFLQHGLLSSSADWVVTGPEHSLAFLLADSGYDVWLGNYRGNRYGLGHLPPQPDPTEFWDFSWDEMAEHDLPAMLGHMMQVTQQDRFHYIGHSMGTLGYFTACNYHPWIANATKLMVGYGAHTRVPHMSSPLFLWLSYWMEDLQWLMKTLGIHEFLPSSWLMEWLSSEVCDEAMATAAVCRNILFLISGYNKAEMNSTMLPVIMGHTPAGTSATTMIHYGQSVKTGAWAGLDRGSAEANIARWNSSSPPEYSYQPITAPVALFWGQNDWLVVPEDEKDLAGRLPNLVTNTRVDEDAYTHLDFLWAMNNRRLLYEPTLEIMKQYLDTNHSNPLN